MTQINNPARPPSRAEDHRGLIADLPAIILDERQ